MMTVPRILPFAVEEYRERVRRVQREMATLDLDALLCHTFSSICYLTGLETIASYKYFVLLIPRDGEPTLLGQAFELYNAWASVWLEDRVGHELDEDPIDATRRLVAERGLGRARLGIEQNSFDLRGDTYDRVRAALPDARWVEAGGLIERVKLIKSPAEIEAVRRAARLTDLGMRAALDEVAAGRTDNEVAAAAYAAIIAGGGEYMCLDPIVTVGPRSGLPHSTHRRVAIRPGDTVFVEIGACVDRYTAPLMRTVVVGPPSGEVRRAADACRAANDATIAGLRPGIAAHEVALTAERTWADVLPGRIWHGIYAYSVGLSFPPKWDDCPFAVRATDEDRVRAGMVLHATTSLREPGRWGVTFSETVVVTAGGCERLTATPRELVVA
jgi:Xaa-Pro dipeptidase